MPILTAVSLTVNVMTAICLAPTIYCYGCSVWEWFEERLRPYRIPIVPSEYHRDDEADWTTIGYGKLFGR